MAASNITVLRAQIDAVDWERLAGLMGIPDDRRRHFIWWLQGAIKGKWRYARKPPEEAWPQANADDAELAKAGRHFMRKLSRSAARAIGKRRQRRVALLKALEQFLDEDVRAARRGAPKREDGFASFLEGLFHITYALGGHASFNGMKARGNLIELMDALRPIMPPDFIPPPDKLPKMSVIERLHTKARKLVLRDMMADPSAAHEVAAITAQFIEVIRHVCPNPKCGQLLEFSAGPGTDCPQ